MVLLQRRFLRQPPWVANELWRRARVTPSLDLRFADTKSLTDAVSGQNLITFTRASTATYVGSDGLIKTAAVDEPRFNHNPTTGESLGLLVEEQRTNLLVRSEEFDNASWIKSSASVTVTANAAVAPDGLTTADKLVEATTSATHVLIAPSVSFSASTTYTYSIFVKAGERSRGLMVLDSSSTIFPAVTTATFNLGTKTITASGTGASATITELANGWFRLSLTATSSSGGTGSSISIRVYDNTGSSNYTGDGTSGFFIWGAQLEAGAFPTSYIPTTSSQVTRSADVASITGTNFSSWYRQDEGAIYCQALATAGTGSSYLYSISDGTNSNFIYAFTSSTASAIRPLYVTTGGVAQVAIAPTSSLGSVKISSAYKVDDFAASLNGGAASIDTSGSIPIVNRLNLAASGAGGGSSSGTLSRLTYWQSRLPNSILQDLTR